MAIELAGDRRRITLLEYALRSKPDALSLLEVGCGSGSVLAAASALYPRAALTGIDCNPKRIEGARRRTPHIRWHTAPVEHLPFSDATFDLVLAGMTFHHWTDKQQGLREIARVLAPDGVFVLVDPIMAGPLSHGWLGRLAQRLDGGQFTDPEDFERMTRRADLRILEQAIIAGSMKTLSVFVLAR